MPPSIARALILIAGAACLVPTVPAAAALITGIVLALSMGNPLIEKTRGLTPRLLSWSVVGLGAGMNLETVMRAGLSGFGYTFVSIAFVLVAGLLVMRLLKVERDAAVLITAGTAICGGSAIAAITPVIRAKSHSVSVALGTVFVLNAAALILFPFLGHALSLSQEQFGLWSALAIHDTSSVVGATVTYGAEAAQVGTTVKLARALWIVPLTLAAAQVFKTKGTPTKKPWFILGFVIAAALVTYVPALKEPGWWVEQIARRTLVLTLFLIGLGLSKETVRQVGWRPFAGGFLLWILTGVATAGAVLLGFVR